MSVDVFVLVHVCVCALPKEGRGPGTHCLRMREIFPYTYRKIVPCTSRATRECSAGSAATHLVHH